MDAEENNELTLQGLAQRLETLERENTELRSKVATLAESGTRRYVRVEKRGSDTRLSEEATALAFDGRVSRRALLSRAGAAAVAAAAAGTLLNPREAKANHISGANSTINANFVNAHVLSADNEQGFAGKVYAAVRGTSSASQGPGVLGQARATGYAGVRGIHEGQQGFGVVGDARGNVGVGVLGLNDDGYGVEGRSKAGIGGLFTGGAAQLRLVPDDKAGPPNRNLGMGALHMDSQATLFVRTAEGNPGQWAKVSTTPV